MLDNRRLQSQCRTRDGTRFSGNRRAIRRVEPVIEMAFGAARPALMRLPGGERIVEALYFGSA